MCDWIEAINSGKHQGPSSFLKEMSRDVVIHAGHLQFHQCLDVRKTKMTEIINKIHGHSQREARAHSEDGVVEEGTLWVILRNNGVLEKVVLSKDPCEGGESQPITEEWINLSDVTSIHFSGCKATTTGCVMEVYAPPSRFVLKAESVVECCRWVNCFRQILAKSGQESIISSDLNTASLDNHGRKRPTCTSAKAIFRKPSVDIQTTYYITPEEVNCFSSDESLEEGDQKLHGSGASSTDSGVGSELCARESYSYLQLLPNTTSQEHSSESLVSAPHADYSSIRHKRLVFELPGLPQSELPTCNDSDDESDLYCDIEDPRRRSLHIYDSIMEYSKAVDLHFETIDETGKEESDGVSEHREDSPLPSVPAQQEPEALPPALATTADGCTDGQDSQKMDCVGMEQPQIVLEQYIDIATIIERKEPISHLTSGMSLETLHVDQLSPPPDSPDLQCSDVEEDVSWKELSPSPETSQKDPSTSPEMNQKELSPSLEMSQKDPSPSPIQDEASLRELSPSPIQEDDYIPMKSAGLADDIQTFREEVTVRLQVDWRSPTTSLTPEQAQVQRKLSVATAIYAPSPPPLPPRNYTKRTQSPHPQTETMQRGRNRLQRCTSNSSMDSLDSESSHLSHKGSFRNVRHLLGSFIHDSSLKGEPEMVGEVTEKRKMVVYKTAEILNLDGGIGLSGNQHYSSLRHKKKDERMRMLERSDSTSSTLLLTKKGIRSSSRHRPALSNVFDTACNLSETRSMGSSSSVSCAEDDDEPSLPPRTSSCSGRVNSGYRPSMPCFGTFERTRSQSIQLRRCGSTGTLPSKSAVSEPQCRTPSSPDNQAEDGWQTEVRTVMMNKADRSHTGQPTASLLVNSHVAESNPTKHSEQLRQLDEVDKGRSDAEGIEQLKQADDVSSSGGGRAPVDKGKQREEALPPGWDKALDPERGMEYYFNSRTQDVTWNWEEVFQLAKQCELVSGWDVKAHATV